MKSTIVGLDRCYMLTFREEFNMIFNEYCYISLITDPNFLCKNKNFIKIKRKIRKFHNFNICQNQICILKLSTSISLSLWKDFDILVISQLVCLSFHKYVPIHRILELHNSKQSLIIFLENRLRINNWSIEIHRKNYGHPEILFRIMRQYFSDTCMLNLIRLILYNGSNYSQPYNEYINYIIDKLKYFIETELDNFLISSLYDLYIFFKTQSQNYSRLIVRQKWALCELNINNQSNRLKKIYRYVYRELLYSVHYLRYSYGLLLIIQGKHYFIKLMARRLHRFLKRRLYFYSRYLKIYNKKVPIHCLEFMVKTKKHNQKCQITHYINRLNILIQYGSISIIIDQNFLIKYLYKYQICSQNGYPLSKINWISLNDIQIFIYFQQVYNELYFCYSGVSNQHMIEYLYYILKYSYTKTIAFKHKKSLRFILRFYTKLKPLNTYINNTLYLKTSLRIWHLDIMVHYPK